MSGGSGVTSPRVYASFGPLSQSSRTFEDYLPLTVDTLLPESCTTFTAWGSMSVDGVLSELPMPAPLIAARESSSCVSLPTPVVNDMGAGKTVEKWDFWTAEMKARHGNSNGHGKSLSIEAQRLLPTPRTSDTNGPGLHGDGGMDLRTAATRLLPTPRAQNGEPRNMKPWVRPLDQPQNLENAIARLLPTPTTGDSKVFGPNIDWKKRQENHHPSTASALMALRLNDGNESSADAPPIPPTNAA